MKIVRSRTLTIRKTQEAMAQVEANTRQQWSLEAENVVLWLATRAKEFSTDDVWEELARRGVEEPHERRALGPVMSRLRAQGYIEFAGVTVSDMPSCHGRRKTTYTGTGKAA